MKAILRDSAVEDLKRICGWIAKDSPANAQTVAERILDAIENKLAWFPYMGRAGRIDGTREWLVTGLPYIIAYRIDDRRDVIYVEAVFHGAQNR